VTGDRKFTGTESNNTTVSILSIAADSLRPYTGATVRVFKPTTVAWANLMFVYEVSVVRQLGKRCSQSVVQVTRFAVQELNFRCSASRSARTNVFLDMHAELPGRDSDSSPVLRLFERRYQLQSPARSLYFRFGKGGFQNPGFGEVSMAGTSIILPPRIPGADPDT